jgi:protein TonB
MFDHDNRIDLHRWTTSALVVTVLHCLLLAAWASWPDDPPPEGSPIPPIVVELSAAVTSPTQTPLDLAPGPVMQQAVSAAAPSETEASAVEQAIAPTPPQPDAEVVLPARSQREQNPSDAKTQTNKEKAKLPERQKLVEDRKKKSVEQTPAPRTTAAPRAEQRAEKMASAPSGMAAMASVLPSYRDRLAAHLQRYKQYPPELRNAGIRGTSMLSFTVNRSGQVLSSRLGRSSGNAGLDAETMAMIRRAQPLPSFPPEISVSSMSFTVPVQFSVR